MQEKMLQSIAQKTGKDPLSIIREIQNKNFEKHADKINYVKKNYGLGHGFANLLALKSKEDANLSDQEMIAKQYKGKEDLLPLFEKIYNYAKSIGNVELAPKKNYVSLVATKQFGIIQPSTKNRIDLGLKFPKGQEVLLEKSGTFNAMVTHRIRLESLDDFDETAQEYLLRAYKCSI